MCNCNCVILSIEKFINLLEKAEEKLSLQHTQTYNPNFENLNKIKNLIKLYRYHTPTHVTISHELLLDVLDLGE